MRDRRDEALVRLMAETGARAAEVLAMQVADVTLAQGTAVVRRGKGGRGRVIPYGPQTTKALDRYIRARRTHRLAETPALWLGDRGKSFSYYGLHAALKARAAAAGIDDFRPHRLRHTPPTAGSKLAAPKAGSWPSPAGPAPTCCCATPEPAPPNAPLLKPDRSTWGTCDARRAA